MWEPERIETFFAELPSLGRRLGRTELATLRGQAKAALGAYMLSVFGTRAVGSPTVPCGFLRKACPELVRRGLSSRTAPEEAASALSLAGLILWESGALGHDGPLPGLLDEGSCAFIGARLSEGGPDAGVVSLMRIQHAYGRHVDGSWTAYFDPSAGTPDFLEIPGDGGRWDALARRCREETQRLQLSVAEACA